MNVGLLKLLATRFRECAYC